MLKNFAVVPLALAVLACGREQATVSAQASAAKPAMPLDMVRAAIAGKPTPVNYELSTDDGFALAVFTPYERIAAAAEEARAAYRPFTEADVTPELSAPEVRIYAPSVSGSNVVTIVIAPRQNTDPALVIRPLRMERADPSTPGAIAVLPFDAMTEHNEVRVVYDGPNFLCQKPGPGKGTAECIVPIRVEKVR